MEWSISAFGSTMQLTHANDIARSNNTTIMIGITSSESLMVFNHGFIDSYAFCFCSLLILAVIHTPPKVDTLNQSEDTTMFSVVP
jgi:hypothetical protein